MSSILETTERIHAALDYHLQRHNLLTANLTQIDTPGFRPLDLVRRASFDAELHTALSSTDEGHIAGTHAAGDGRYDVVPDPTATVGFDGNGVSVDREAVKIAANQIRYDTLAVLASQQLSGLHWAANDGRT
jgi:flagellar basal-body rod protein FlgB